MIQIAWKSLFSLGFILFLLFSGCGERQVSIEELVQQAESLMEVGQIDGAIVTLERCLEREPNRVDVLELLAFAYSANADPVLAAITFKRIAELVPQQSEYLLYSAESLIEAGDMKGAVSRYEEYLRVRPNDRPVWITLAELHVNNGRLSEALEAYLAAEQLESRAIQQVAIGELYLRSQNLAQAQAWFARALNGDSEARDEALMGLLETAIRSKQFPEAEALLAQIDGEYPGLVDQSPLDSVRDQLAEWSRRREAAKAALAALESRATEQREAPEAPEPEAEVVSEPLETVEVESVASEPELTEPTVPEEALIEELPAQPMPLDHVALAREAQDSGDLPEAIRHYKQALVQNDAQPLVWAELSEAYLQSGNDRWAQATANEALRRDPDNPKFILQFLRAAQRTMEPARLIREMEDAYRRFPEQPELVLVLARAYTDEGNTRNARLLFRKFLELVPPSHPERMAAEIELERLGG